MFVKYKRILSIFFSAVLSMSLIMTKTIYTYADTSEKIDQSDLETILNDSIIMTEAWKSIGFTSEQIINIMKMDRAEGSEELLENNNLLNETDATRILEDELADKSDIGINVNTRATNGNPPLNSSDQTSRIIHVYNDAYSLYKDKSNVNNYIVYLYLSHYVDNPNYNRNSPNFDSIYADVITSSDISAYNTFIKNTKFTTISNDIVHFFDGVNGIASTGADAVEFASNGKNIAVNTVNLVRDIQDLPDNIDDVNTAIYDVVTKRYSSGFSADEMIDEINKTLDDSENEEIINEYASICVTGMLSMLASTIPVIGMSVSMTVFYYDCYSSIINRARLAALQYSYSTRVTLRMEQALYG